MIRIGTNPIAWSNDDLPELGGDIPLETCLREARAAGFSGIELGNKFPRDAAKLKPILAAHGLDLVSGWYSTALLVRGADEEFGAARAHIDLLKAFGCGVMIVAETSNAIHARRDVPLSRRPELSGGDWPGFAERLTEFASRLGDEGLSLVYHHHMGTIVQTQADIDRLMETCGDPVSLLLDTGHAVWGGSDPAQLARRHRERIRHVHCKDARAAVMAQANAEDWSFLDAVVSGVYTVPGDGAIDFGGVLKELAGYQGWLVVEAEQDPKQALPAEYSKLGFENLVVAARVAGLHLSD